jgi:hypothetical protein
VCVALCVQPWKADQVICTRFYVRRAELEQTTRRRGAPPRTQVGPGLLSAFVHHAKPLRGTDNCGVVKCASRVPNRLRRHFRGGGVITDRNVLDTLQLHLSTPTRLYVSHFHFHFFESIFFPKDKPETRAVSHLSDLFVSIHHKLTLSHNLSYSCPMLGVGIPVRKDSMSMAMRWCDSQSGEERSVTAPLSLIVTAFAGVEDVGATWTPQLRTDLNGPTVLVFFDLAYWKQRLGGSALAQVFRQIGAEVPDVEDPHLLKAFFNACQAVRKSDPDLVLAYHDRSDGSLFTTVAEMAFAGRVGVEVNLDAMHGVDGPVEARNLVRSCKCSNRALRASWRSSSRTVSSPRRFTPSEKFCQTPKISPSQSYTNATSFFRAHAPSSSSSGPKRHSKCSRYVKSLIAPPRNLHRSRMRRT